MVDEHFKWYCDGGRSGTLSKFGGDIDNLVEHVVIDSRSDYMIYMAVRFDRLWSSRFVRYMDGGKNFARADGF